MQLFTKFDVYIDSLLRSVATGSISVYRCPDNRPSPGQVSPGHVPLGLVTIPDNSPPRKEQE